MKIKSFSFGKFNVRQAGLLIVVAAIGMVIAFFGTIMNFVVDLA